jgi:hypothetical protein
MASEEVEALRPTPWWRWILSYVAGVAVAVFVQYISGVAWPTAIIVSLIVMAVVVGVMYRKQKAQQLRG